MTRPERPKLEKRTPARRTCSDLCAIARVNAARRPRGRALFDAMTVAASHLPQVICLTDASGVSPHSDTPSRPPARMHRILGPHMRMGASNA